MSKLVMLLRRAKQRISKHIDKYIASHEKSENRIMASKFANFSCHNRMTINLLAEFYGEKAQNYQKDYQKNLKESHSKTLLSNNDLGIYLLDDSYRLLEFNNRFRYWFKAIYGIEPVVGTSIFETLEWTLVEDVKKWRSRYERSNCFRQKKEIR